MVDLPQSWHYGLMAQWWAEFNVEAPELGYYKGAIERYGQPALDLACGTGRLLVPLLKDGLDVDGCDLSADMLACCRLRAERMELSPRLYLQAMHALDLPRRYRSITMRSRLRRGEPSPCLPAGEMGILPAPLPGRATSPGGYGPSLPAVSSPMGGGARRERTSKPLRISHRSTEMVATEQHATFPRARPRISVATLLAAAVLAGAAGRMPARAAGVTEDPSAQSTAVQQFYERVLGHWVGTTVSRTDGEAPVTGYFHAVIERVDAGAFREEYIQYRVLPKTGALERAGTQSFRSTIESSGVIRRTYQGSGTVLMDSKPRKQSFEARGEMHSAGPNQLAAEAQGKIAVAGLPFNAGKNGKLQKASATLALEGDELVGQTRFDAVFRVLLFKKRYRMDIELRGRRGADVQAVVNRGPKMIGSGPRAP